jgi:hypothetical protein
MAGLLIASENTWITSTVASILDQSLPLYRKTTSADGHGGTTETYPGNPTHTIACNIIKPSASVLQTYAGIIASQRSLVLRVMNTADVLEGDRIVYDSLNWVVQALMDASSYTVTKEYIISVVA